MHIMQSKLTKTTPQKNFSWKFLQFLVSVQELTVYLISE